MNKPPVYRLLLLSAMACMYFAGPYCPTGYAQTEKATKATRPPGDARARGNSLNLSYYPGWDFEVVGKFHSERTFNRLPERYQAIVRPAVWELSRYSSGIALRFKTNSPLIAARWTLLRNTRRANMTRISSSGLDLYGLVNGHWQYVNSAIPIDSANHSVLISDRDTIVQEFLLHLPLYDGIDRIEIGIHPTYTISAPERLGYVLDKPIVFYGTSITQGASASRPGMAYPSIISRSLNIETINLGFSGNGRFETSVGRALCEIDAALFVIDCTPNSPPDTIRANALPLLRQIRQCRPSTPILLVESITRAYAYFRKSDASTFGSFSYIHAQNKALNDVYQDALHSGIPGVYYLKGDDLIGADREGTVDGTHLSDLGMYRMANSMKAEIIRILNLHQKP